MNRLAGGTGAESRAGGGGRSGVVPVVIRMVLPVVVLAAGVAAYVLLSRKAPEPSPPPPARRTLEVEVRELRREDYQVMVRSQGAVRAHSEVDLTAQVAGRVRIVHPEFEEGAFFGEGKVLVELDPVDFELALAAAETELAQARLALSQEQTRATQARLDWKDLGYEGEASDLVLRRPQLKLAELQVELAEERRASAQRDLERTKIRAPFDGRVLKQGVGVGQTIGAGSSLGTVFATDYSEVRLPVAMRFLRHLSLPEDASDPPVEVRLGDALVPERDVCWKARILRTEGALDESTLELFAIARIGDPFGLETEREPLRIGQPVFADIPGRVIEDVFVIPREAVTGLSRIRLVDRGEMKLQSATIEAVWEDEEHLVFRDAAIDDGMLLVMTNLVYAPDGAEVEIVEDEVLAAPGGTAGGAGEGETMTGAGT